MSKEIHNLALTQVIEVHSKVIEVDFVPVISLVDGADGHGGEYGR